MRGTPTYKLGEAQFNLSQAGREHWTLKFLSQPYHQLAVDNLTRPGLIDLKDEITMAKASRKLGRASVRQAEPDPFSVVLHLDKWTNLSLSNKIHRNYKGLKKTPQNCACTQLRQIMDNKTKDQKEP